MRSHGTGLEKLSLSLAVSISWFNATKESFWERTVASPVGHVTIWRWVQSYAIVLNQRIRCELRQAKSLWRVDEM